MRPTRRPEATRLARRIDEVIWLLSGLLALVVAACGSAGFSPQPPDLRGSPKLWVPAFTTGLLTNGMRVHVNADPYLPMVSVAVGIRGGFLMDTPSNAGLTHFFVENLLARSQRLDRLALANAMDVVGGRIRSQIMGDGIVLSIDVLEDRVAGAIKLLAEILARPGFDAEQMERIRSEQRSNLEDGFGNPGTVAVWGLRQVIFGPQHPMGLPELGTRSSIARFTLEDLQKRARDVLRPQQMVLVLAGRVDPALAQKAAQTFFGDWTVETLGPRLELLTQVGPGPEPADREQIYFIPQAGATQTTIAVGRRGLPITDPKYHYLRMVAGRAPGGASSWLRGIEHVTYGVGQLGEANTRAGYFGARLSVDTTATAVGLQSIVSRYGARLGGAVDLEKVGLLTSEGQPFFTLNGRSTKVARQHVMGLPLDHFAQLRERIDDVRPATVEIETQWLIDDAVLQVVLVGDEAALRTAVPGTGLGTLTPLALAAQR